MSGSRSEPRCGAPAMKNGPAVCAGVAAAGATQLAATCARARPGASSGDAAARTRPARSNARRVGAVAACALS